MKSVSSIEPLCTVPLGLRLSLEMRLHTSVPFFLDEGIVVCETNRLRKGVKFTVNEPLKIVVFEKGKSAMLMKLLQEWYRGDTLWGGA